MSTLAKPVRAFARPVMPGSFEAHNHWYPKALNATIHPMVNFFLNLDQERIITRYCHLYPKVRPKTLREILNYHCRYFLWGGADLINVTSAGGRRQMVVIENNSCPSGQKSMPLINDHDEHGTYRILMEQTFQPHLKKRRPVVKGGLAVIYDKNPMEVTGYASVMADVFKEPVFLVTFYKDNPRPAVKFENGVMHVRSKGGKWHPIRAAFRYLTQKPWNRLPVHTKTRILNPTIACLAGGRNKMIAAKAYDQFNEELEKTNLAIRMPETIRDVKKEEIPEWVTKMGGHAVIKVPYSNAGQGVYTIVTKKELEAFMEMEFEYDRFIVQSLIGNYNWSSTSSTGKFYHVGTVPNKLGKTFVSDLRMMVSSTPSGIKPICVYARRGKLPLADRLREGDDSWAMLGTNLSVKNQDGSWGSDTNRLMLMDRRDFNKLGMGMDDLIEAFIQTVLSMIAIDKMAQQLMTSDGKFRMRLFKKLNDDPALINEILL